MSSLIRSAEINWRPGKFFKKMLMIQSHERNIKSFRAASSIRQQQQTPAIAGKNSMDANATNIRDANKSSIAISSRNDRNDGNTSSRRDVNSRRDVSRSSDANIGRDANNSGDMNNSRDSRDVNL